MGFLRQSLGKILDRILGHILHWWWRRLRERAGIWRCWRGLLFALAR